MHVTLMPTSQIVMSTSQCSVILQITLRLLSVGSFFSRFFYLHLRSFKKRKTSQEPTHKSPRGSHRLTTVVPKSGPLVLRAHPFAKTPLFCLGENCQRNLGRDAGVGFGACRVSCESVPYLNLGTASPFIHP